MAMAITVPHYTVDDLERFPNDGNRYELLDGVLLVTPAPNTAHQIIANRIQSRLTAAVQWTGAAHVVGPGVVVRAPNTQLQPDVLVFPATYKPDIDWRKITEHWLAVEVLSRSSRIYDREFKKDAYFALGVRQVWLVDRWTKGIEVWRSPSSKKVARTTLGWQAPTRDVSMALDLDEVFAGID
jgi:Uma2 family endonuclease